MLGAVVSLWLVTAVLAISESDKTMLDDLFTNNYQRDTAPDEPDTTIVKVGAYINSVWVNDGKNELKLRLILREMWTDPRLTYTGGKGGKPRFIIVPKKLENKFWLPDLYFKKTLNIQRYQEPHDQRLQRLYSNGTVWRATAYTVSFLCRMDLRRFPKDDQTCQFELESFTRTGSQMNITFLDNTAPLVFADDPVVTPEWKLNDFEHYECRQKYFTGNYSCVGFRMFFERDPGRFAQQAHAPFVLLLISLYASYFISRKSTYLRFAYVFLIGIFMIAAAMNIHMSSKHPRVPYFTGADFLEGIGFFLYFCVVFHNIFVLSLQNKGLEEGEPPPWADTAQWLDRIGMAAYPIFTFVFFIAYFGALT